MTVDSEFCKLNGDPGIHTKLITSSSLVLSSSLEGGLNNGELWRATKLVWITIPLRGPPKIINMRDKNRANQSSIS